MKTGGQPRAFCKESRARHQMNFGRNPMTMIDITSLDVQIRTHERG